MVHFNKPFNKNVKSLFRFLRANDAYRTQLFTSLRKSIILPFCAFYVLRTKTIINRDKLIVGFVGVDRFISVNQVEFGLFFSLVGFWFSAVVSTELYFHFFPTLTEQLHL